MFRFGVYTFHTFVCVFVDCLFSWSCVGCHQTVFSCINYITGKLSTSETTFLSFFYFSRIDELSTTLSNERKAAKKLLETHTVNNSLF